MNRIRAWLLGCVLTLLGTPALADLQLELQASGLAPQQTQATQALLDEAMGKLPPRFKQQLDAAFAAYIRTLTQALVKAVENLHNKYAVTLKMILAERDLEAQVLDGFLKELGYA